MTAFGAAGGSKSVVFKPYTKAQAITNKEAITQKLYNLLFQKVQGSLLNPLAYSISIRLTLESIKLNMFDRSLLNGIMNFLFASFPS